MAIAIAVLISFAAFSGVPAEARQHGHGGGGYHGGGYHGGGHVHVGVGFGYYGYWGGYYPWFYWGPYSPFWYPSPYFYPPYAYGWYGGGYPYYPTSSVRIEVTPREAKVFVDNYFAGTVDDYDGTFQRLHVSPGKHEILLYLEGYHSLKQTLYLSPDSTYKMKGAMTKLAAGDPPEPPPPSPPPPQQGGNGQPGPPDQNEGPFGPPPPQGTDVRPGPPPQGYEPQQPPPPMSQPNTRFGRLVVRVQPTDAEIYVDGERWQTPDTAERLEVNLVAGRHHVEIHKSGFDSFSTEVDVRPGQTTPVNVSLPQSH